MSVLGEEIDMDEAMGLAGQLAYSKFALGQCETLS